MSNKDWTGNFNSIYKTLGASNHTEEEREPNDFYATDPKAMQILLQHETFNTNVWECACGQGHLSKVLKENGYLVKSSDIIDRGFEDTEIIDFLNAKKENISFCGDIITNPPYKYAKEFVEKALELSSNKVAMFLKLTFLEGQARQKLFKKFPPRTVYVFSSRIQCAKNGDFKGTSAVAYAWFVWEKDFKGKTTIEWIN